MCYWYMADLKHDGEHEQKGYRKTFSYATSIKLVGTNYDIWFRFFLMVVIGNDKKFVLEGDIPTKNIEKYVFWEKENVLVMSWMMNNIDSSVAAIITFYSTAKMLCVSIRDLLTWQEYNEDIWTWTKTSSITIRDLDFPKYCSINAYMRISSLLNLK